MPRWTTDKDTEKFLRDLERDGWTVRRTGKLHLIATAPNGERVSCAYTTSSQASIMLYRQKARRIRERMAAAKGGA